MTAAGTTNFIWDGQDVLLETDVSNNTQVTYTQTPNLYGDLVSQRRGDTISFYDHGALDSILTLTDTNGAITDTINPWSPAAKSRCRGAAAARECSSTLSRAGPPAAAGDWAP